MNNINHFFSNSWSKLKDLITPTEAPAKIEKAASTATTVDPYYVDTIAPAPAISEVPNIIVDIGASSNISVYQGKLEQHLEELSFHVNAHLALDKKDFEKLHAMIYQVIMALMRLSGKDDSQLAYETSLKITAEAKKIQGTYNTWAGLTITVVSATVSIGAGFAGLATFAPASVMTAETAKALSKASTGIGSAGTGIGGFGTIVNNSSQGKREVMQIHLQQIQGHQQGHKEESKDKKNLVNSAKAASDEFHRVKHQAASAV
jgi:hypothetical protein